MVSLEPLEKNGQPENTNLHSMCGLIFDMERDEAPLTKYRFYKGLKHLESDYSSAMAFV